TDAWTCGGVPVLLYGDVDITYNDDSAHVDAEQFYSAMVASDGGRVQEIDGHPAYVHPADADGPRNGVVIIVGKYSVELVAKSEVGIDRVLEVAGKIHIPTSVS